VEKTSTAENQSHVVLRRTCTSNHVGNRVDNKKTEENLSMIVSCIHSLATQQRRNNHKNRTMLHHNAFH
jgi:hypothetical protein